MEAVKSKLKESSVDCDREMTYIDDEGDYITIEDESDWSTFLECVGGGTEGELPTVLMFDRKVNEKLMSLVGRGMKKVAKNENVVIENSIIEEIVEEIKLNKKTFSVADHEALSNSDQKKEIAVIENLEKEVEKLVQERITSGELKLVAETVSDDNFDKLPLEDSKVSEPDACGFITYFRRVYESAEERRAKRREKWRKIQKKGIKRIKKHVKLIGKAGKSFFKAVASAFKL